MVCAVCAFCNSIICGLTYSYGIFFPALLDEFHQGKANTGDTFNCFVVVVVVVVIVFVVIVHA